MMTISLRGGKTVHDLSQSKLSAVGLHFEALRVLEGLRNSDRGKVRYVEYDKVNITNIRADFEQHGARCR